MFCSIKIDSLDKIDFLKLKYLLVVYIGFFFNIGIVNRQLCVTNTKITMETVIQTLALFLNKNDGGCFFI